MKFESDDYWTEAELESVRACPACGESATRDFRYRRLHDHLERVPGEWSMYQCGRCRSLYLAVRPTEMSVGKAYGSYYTHASAQTAHSSDNGKSLFWRLANGYLNAKYGARRSPALRAGRYVMPIFVPLRQQLDYFLRHLPVSPGRLLDVGCGNGLFLLRAMEAGWEAVGLEPDPVALQAARTAGIAAEAGTLDAFRSEGAFDVVTASHVIEHVHEPREFLRRIAQLLAPGGTIWLATPNAGSLGRWWYGSAWRGLEPPRHITVFSASALRRLLEEAGFRSIKFHRRGRGARYVLRASYAAAAGTKSRRPVLPAGLVDLAATCWTSASEELVVSARLPNT